MRLVIGLDLRGRAAGALAFGTWVARHVAEKAPLVAAHIVDDGKLFALAERALAETLTEHGATELFSDSRVFEGDDPAQRLAVTVQGYNADALVLGRRAPSDGDQVFRLGRIARRATRQLVAPVIVVPPDLGAADFARGPILLATDHSHESEAAGRFAQRLAKIVGREVVVVHVAQSSARLGLHALPKKNRRNIDDDLFREATTELDAFLARVGAPDAERQVLQGDVVEALLGAASAREALAVVVGSRRLGTIARFFSASIGTELAAHAPVPVVIVPPEDA